MATVGKARGTYAKSAGRRDAILRASVQVFSESGFRGGSIREIADRVGLSQAGLLHHFPTKYGLLLDVLTQRDELARDRMGDAEALSLPTGIALIRGMVELADFNATTPGMVALFSVLSGEATAPEHPANGYFRDRYAYVVGLLTDAFALAGHSGDLKPDVDPAAAARTVVALFDGLQIQWLYEDCDLDMAADLRRYVQSLLTIEL